MHRRCGCELTVGNDVESETHRKSKFLIQNLQVDFAKALRLEVTFFQLSFFSVVLICCRMAPSALQTEIYLDYSRFAELR